MAQRYEYKGRRILERVSTEKRAIERCEYWLKRGFKDLSINKSKKKYSKVYVITGYRR